MFNLVTGPGPVVGNEIAANPGVHGVAFIGSTTTGRLVAQAAAGKVALLEMGGNGPVVVMDDADVDAAVEATLTACYLCAGQSCTAGERILVHRAVRDEYLEKLARRVTEQVLLGDPFDDATTMGPVNNEQVAAKMDEHVADAVDRGASVVAGGERAGGFPTDLYWQATILADVPADARVATEETFGPVAPLVEIDSLEQAIELTNASPYGLLSAIFTADLNRGLQFAERVRTGWVNINESSNYWESHLPFGGRSGTDSGVGRVGGVARHAAVHRAADRGPLALGGSEDRADLALEGDDVVAGDRPRALGVAVADRGQQVAVLVHPRRQVRQAVDDQVPDAQREVQVAPEGLFEIRVVRALIDEAVHARVEAAPARGRRPWRRCGRARRAAPRAARAGRRRCARRPGRRRGARAGRGRRRCAPGR